VVDGRAHLTNLAWTVEVASLRSSLGINQVFVLNDLTATAYAIPSLEPEDLYTINAGQPEPHGPIAVIAPGTGLGEAFLIWGAGSYIACPSEGGHASFSPTDEQQAALWAYLHKKFGHVSVERVCSGPGISNIYDFLCSARPGVEPPTFAAQLASLTDRTPEIARAGLEDPAGHPLAAEALEIFIGILAGETANLALKVLSTGGVYLAGGVPQRLFAKLTDRRFMQTFVNKGRLSDLVSRMPIHVTLGQTALIGAALYGLERIKSS
jgi:glucokinase